MSARAAFLALVVALAPAAALAHDCDPLAVNATGVQIGTQARTVTTSAGAVSAWWCQYTNATTPAGMVNWREQTIVSLDDCRLGFADIVAAAGRVVAAGTGAYAQFETELRAAMAACVVVEGTPRHYEVRKLKHAGCLVLAANPPPGTPADWLKPADAPATWVPADWCGPAPVAPAPPPPPAGVYVVTSTAAYPLNADGTRSITRWPQPAILGETCDSAVSVLSFGVRFYRVPRLSTTTHTVVAGCALKK